MFGPEARAIYAYHDGYTERRSDPLEIEERWTIGLFEQGTDTTGLGLGSKNLVRYFRAIEDVVPIVREAFDLPPFDALSGLGLTRRGALALVSDFVEWRDEIQARYRGWAAHVGTFGYPPGCTYDYETHCGERWNLDRVRAFEGLAVWQGMRAASGRYEVDLSLVDAMCVRREMVEGTARMIEASRQQAIKQAEAAQQPHVAR